MVGVGALARSPCPTCTSSPYQAWEAVQEAYLTSMAVGMVVACLACPAWPTGLLQGQGAGQAGVEAQAAVGQVAARVALPWVSAVEAPLPRRCTTASTPAQGEACPRPWAC